ncbi:MAG: FecCD family ABC transporter permease [Chitinivibrionales bacterium]
MRIKTAVFLLLCAGAAVITPFFGANFFTPAEIFSDSTVQNIFFRIRIPRVITGFAAGGGLAVAGMFFQAFFRNPLATPFTLGVASGASFGAATAIIIGAGTIAGALTATSAGAFLGAMAATAGVYGFSVVKKDTSSITLLLAGVAVSYLFSSLLMFIHFLGSAMHSFSIIRWLMGGIEVFGYRHLWVIIPGVVLGTGAVMFHLPHLDLLTAGEDTARTRGVDVKRSRLLLFFSTSVMVAAIVSVCGPIGFVGLMSPHICRLLFTSRHTTLAPVSFMFGGAFLVVCDAGARVITAPAELPVGIITALFGGPFFLWLLYRKG